MWPPISPDLNPVDYEVWRVLQRRLYRTRISTVDHLKQRLVKEWRHFSQDIIGRAVRQWHVRPRPHQQQCRRNVILVETNWTYRQTDRQTEVKILPTRRLAAWWETRSVPAFSSWAEITAVQGTSPPEFGVETLMQIISPPPEFCHVSKLQTPNCLHYNAVKSLSSPLF